MENPQTLDLKSNDIDKIKDELIIYNNQINWLYLRFFSSKCFLILCSCIVHRLGTYAFKTSRIMVVLVCYWHWTIFYFIPAIFQEKKKTSKTSLGVHSQTSAGSLKISKLELWKPIPQRGKDVTSEWYCSVEPIAINCLCHNFDTYSRLIKV